MDHTKVVWEGLLQLIIRPRLALLALSPMAEVTANTNQTNEGDATTFNSETHIHFFKEVFHFYGLDFETWTLC